MVLLTNLSFITTSDYQPHHVSPGLAVPSPTCSGNILQIIKIIVYQLINVMIENC